MFNLLSEEKRKRKVSVGYSRATTGDKHISNKYKMVSNDNGLSTTMLGILVVPGGALGFAKFLMCFCSQIK